VRFFRVLWRTLIILGVLLSSFGSIPVAADTLTDAEALLQSMTPEEKVGQLFLVTFEGATVEEGSDIYKLITDYHIGGVVLLAENDNFTSEDTLVQAQNLIASLQQLEWDTTESASIGEGINATEQPAYVPLFIGIPQTGNGFPTDQILSGLTETPSQMAIGATWDLDLASQAGETLGRELNALGFNLYLGPNLDVLEVSNGEAADYLGTETFGGDPYWVGEMGKAFISGVHTGSEDQMLVVAQNFPGTGNSDRSPEEEVATVRKSLDQLKQIELAPFFTVMGADESDPGRIDGVMVSHIRYQGFQGNIRATTKPISFDSTALQQIMALDTISTWRSSGGLIISDNLGSGAVRRFFDPNNESFTGSQVARNAFLAGNDILYVNNFISAGDPDAFTTLRATLDFFAQKYREDSVFAQRVDESILRILNAKQALYGSFTLEGVLPSQDDLSQIGTSDSGTFDVAQNAVTLISPDIDDLDSILPSPPLWYEDIVIFSDVRTDYQCASCTPVNVLKTDSLANALVRLYGAQASGQILQYNLASYTFSQLAETLDNYESDFIEYLLANLQEAEWVVFNILDNDPDHPDSDALVRILEERPDLLANKNVIVFAFDSPVYLDATNITKTTAYYALYSKVPGFVDVAARILMQEITPSGALPISLTAVGYDLIAMTAPDPNQIITLDMVLPVVKVTEEDSEEEVQATQTPEPTPIPTLNVGDTITIRTGVIHDHNGNNVPDGTVVRFNFNLTGEPNITQQFEATTTGGIASLNYRVEAVGGLVVSATSEPATQSETLSINIKPGEPAEVIVISPTPQETPTPTESPEVTPTASGTDAKQTSGHGSYPTLGEWALGVMVLGLASGLAFILGKVWWQTNRWGIRSMLCALIGGLLSYSFLNLGTKGTRYWLETSGTGFVVEVIVVGVLMGWICALVWWLRTDGRYPHRKKG
jgi:beta-N-acetylhexosaminidase